MAGFQKVDQAPSLFNASLGKDGYLRNSINGNRVNDTGRTVATCDPKLSTW